MRLSNTKLSRLSNMLNYLILQKLNNHRRSSPLKQFEFFIEPDVAEYLVQRFKLTGKFKTNKDFLCKLKLMAEKKITSDQSIYIIKDSLELKIARARRVRYLDNQNEVRYVVPDQKLVCRFRVDMSIAQI